MMVLPALLVCLAPLFLLGWLLPNHYPPWLSFYQDFSWFVGLSLSMTVLLKWRVACPRASLCIFLVALTPSLQFSSGIIFFFGDAVFASIYVAAFSGALLAGYNVSSNNALSAKINELFALVFLLGATLSVWIALRQWLLLSGSIWIADLPMAGRPFANLGQPNNLATLLGMGLASVIYFYEKRKLNGVSSGSLAAFLLFGIVLTQSRTPWLAAIAICVFWLWKSRNCQTRLRFPTIFIWAVGFFLMVLALPILAEWLLLSSSNPLDRMRSLHRWDLYKQFITAISSGPVWGYGWNQVSVAQVAVTVTQPVALMTEYTHNILLDLLVWNGPILGGCIILAGAIWLARLAWVARSSESLFALLASGFLFTHSMLEYPHAYAYFLIPLGLLLGIAQAEDQSTKTFSAPRWLLAGLLLSSLGLSGWIWYEYRIVEEDYRLMRFETANIGNLKSEYPAPDVVLLTQLREFTRFARTEASELMSEEELEWMRKVAHRYPYLPSLFRYSYALALNYRTDESFDQLLIIRGLYGEESYQNIVRLLYQNQGIHPQLALLTKKVSAERD